MSENVNLADKSQLALWQSYCDKKMECESLVEEVERLRGERDELVKLFDGLERVTDIWLPQNVDQEHIGEAECLHGFRRAYLELLAKIKGEDNE